MDKIRNEQMRWSSLEIKVRRGEVEMVEEEDLSGYFCGHVTCEEAGNSCWISLYLVTYG